MGEGKQNMKTITRYLKGIYSGPFQATLVFSFALVAAITIGVNAWVISGVINNYLTEVMDERVARDSHLAETFYEIKLNEVAGIAEQLARSFTVINNLESAQQGDLESLNLIEAKIINTVSGPALGGNLYVAIVNVEGDVMAGRLVSTSGMQTPIAPGENWSALPLYQEYIHSESEHTYKMLLVIISTWHAVC